MSGAFVLVEIAGFVALLLWGTHMVTTGVLRGYGAALRQSIGTALGSPFRAFSSGVVVTLALQSSTATGLMASSFAAHGILAAAPGFVLMLGANVGTALVTQVFTFPTSVLVPPLLLAGYVLFRKSASSRWRQVGRACIGMGLMFVALHGLVDTFRPLADLGVVREIFASLGDQPFLALLLGAAAAWACHSSVAVVLLALSIAAAGALPLPAGLALMLGANLGGAVPPVMEASGPVGRRLPLGNFLVRAVGVCAGMAALPWMVALLEALGHTQARALVDAHVAFNLVVALVALPMAKPASAFLVRLLPDPPLPSDPAFPRYLDDAVLDQPHLVLANAERESLRLADTLSDQLRQARSALVSQGADAVAACGQLGDAITGLGRAIRHHLGRLPPQALSAQEARRVQELLAFVVNAEHVADIVPHHLVEPVVRRSLGGDVLSPPAQKMIDEVMERILEGQGLAVAALIRRDLRAAHALVMEKTRLREKEHQWAMGTVGNIGWSTVQGGVVEVDAALRALRECRRIYGHLGAIAYLLLEEAGQLRSRVALEMDES